MTVKESSRVKELKSALAGRVAEANRISETFKFEDGDKVVISTEQHKAYNTAIREANDLRALIAAEGDREALNAYLDAPEGKSYAGMDAAHAELAGTRHRTLSDAFFASDAYREMKSAKWRNLGQTAEFEQGMFSFAERKDIFSMSAGSHTLTAFGTQQDVGITERMRRPGRIRDLFGVETTTSNMLYGIRQTGFVNAAKVVPEREQPDGSAALGDDTDVFGRAPRSRLKFKPYQVPVVEIAHIEYVHKNVLEDESRLRGIIDRDMVDGVKMTEDYELLYGPGEERITGLFNTPGVQTYGGVSGEKPSTQLRRAATRSILAYFEPNGIVMHPYDWENVELEQDENGAYTIAVSVAVGGEKRVWRMSIVDTPAIQQGSYVLGSFGYGGKLYERQSTALTVSSENVDSFERGFVTIRAASRVGLVVDRPESWVLGEFAAA